MRPVSDVVEDVPPRLEARGIGKRFPGVHALDDVDFHVAPGEVVALVGENGAGKSTLMKILAGIQPPDAGEIRLDGTDVTIDSVPQAIDLGIALIHQELNLTDNLDVGANIFLGREPRRGPRGVMIDRRDIRERAVPLLRRVGLDVDPRVRVGDLPLGRRQLVEIAKALSMDARVLLMDEPTSSLSHDETERLFDVIRDLARSRVAVVYISHRLGEVDVLADRVSVLRDGKNAGEFMRDEITREAIVSKMVGRDLDVDERRSESSLGDVVLDVRDLRTIVHPTHAVSLTVRAGETVGLAGLVGAGRTDLLRTMFGVVSAAGGEVCVDGRRVVAGDPRAAIRAGVALVPEDRKNEGLILEMDVRTNTSLASLEDRANDETVADTSTSSRRRRLIDQARERRLALDTIERLAIKTPHDRQSVKFLSGGNQQKIVIGKWLATNPRVFLLDEPTRGVDVGAKREIYALMDELAARGAAVLFASSEMEEVLALSDRVLVMYEGRLAGELQRKELTEEAVMTLATGGAVSSRLDASSA